MEYFDTIREIKIKETMIGITGDSDGWKSPIVVELEKEKDE